MPCSPLDNSLNPPITPPIPGLGLPFAPLQIPFPDVALPEGFPEDLLDLLNKIGAFLAPGVNFKPNLDDLTKTILQAIAKLMDQVAPFIGMYRFLMALLNMVLCILSVLCALPDPFAFAKAMRRLFGKCIPDFLRMFPWLALLAMIIALLLLLLALIEYIILTIIAIILEIIRNLVVLGKAFDRSDPEGQLAAAQKIAGMLCLIENLFAILLAIAAVMAIIKDLANIEVSSLCAGGRAKGFDLGYDEEVCPPLIQENPDGLSGTAGTLLYHRTFNPNFALLFGSIPGFDASNYNFAPLRQERWQFFDQETGRPFNFKDIITQVEPGGRIYFPEGITFYGDSNLKKVPYTIDMRLLVNPATFGHADPIGGARYFRITNIVVTEKPIVGYRNFANAVATTYDNNPADTGTLSLAGGLVFEDDGTTPFNIGTTQATLNTLIDLDAVTAGSGGGLPQFEDGYGITDIEWDLKINHEALVSYDLIVVGCIPDIDAASVAVNAEFTDAFVSVANKITFPDIEGAVQCMQTALDKFRKDGSIANAEIMQSELVGCLNDLTNQTEQAIDQAINAGFSQFGSDATLDPDVQFVGLPIKASVVLRDANQLSLVNNLPSSLSDDFASKLSGTVTFGSVSAFTYDGYGAFDAEITATQGGQGELKVSFDGQSFLEVINRDDVNQPIEIQERAFPYTFISGAVEATDQETPRRDDTDVANDVI